MGGALPAGDTAVIAAVDTATLPPVGTLVAPLVSAPGDVASLPGAGVTVGFSVRNQSASVRAFTLSAGASDAAVVGSLSFAPASVMLGPGAAAAVTVSYTVDAGAEANRAAVVSLSAVDQGASGLRGTGFFTQSVQLNVLSPEVTAPARRVIDAGAVTSVAYALRNLTNAPRVLSGSVRAPLFVSGPGGACGLSVTGSSGAVGALNYGALQSASAAVSYQSASGCEGGTVYRVGFQLVDTEESGAVGVGELELEVRLVLAAPTVVSPVPSPETLAPGTRYTRVFRVTNRSNARRVYDFSATSGATGVARVTSVGAGREVLPGQSVDVPVVVELVAGGIEGSMADVSFIARDRLAGAYQAAGSYRVVVARVAAAPTVTGLSGGASLYQGQDYRFSVRVRNGSNGPSALDLATVLPPEVSYVSGPRGAVSFGPYETKTLTYVFRGNTPAMGARAVPERGYTVRVDATEPGFAGSGASGTLTILNRAPVLGPLVASWATAVMAQQGKPVTWTAAASDPDGDPLTCDYRFGDGTGAPGVPCGAPGVSHSYASGGTYLADVVVRDGHATNGSVSGSASVGVNTPPTAAFSVPDTIWAGEPARFVSGARDVDGDIPRIAWSVVVGGSAVTGTGAEFSATFPSAGAYDVVMGVDDGRGGSARLSRRVSAIANQAPSCSAVTAAPQSPLVGAEVVLKATCSDPEGQALTLTWDYGDGTPVRTLAPDSAKNVYTQPSGREGYMVTVTPTDSRGKVGTAATVAVVVTKPVAPTARLSMAPTDPYAQEDIVFDGSGSTVNDTTQKIVDWQWKFGDLTQTNGERVVKRYAVDTYPDSIWVKLIVTQTDGQQGKDSIKIAPKTTTYARFWTSGFTDKHRIDSANDHYDFRRWIDVNPSRGSTPIARVWANVWTRMGGGAVWWSGTTGLATCMLKDPGDMIWQMACRRAGGPDITDKGPEYYFSNVYLDAARAGLPRADHNRNVWATISLPMQELLSLDGPGDAGFRLLSTRVRWRITHADNLADVRSSQGTEDVQVFVEDVRGRRTSYLVSGIRLSEGDVTHQSGVESLFSNEAGFLGTPSARVVIGADNWAYVTDRVDVDGVVRRVTGWVVVERDFVANTTVRRTYGAAQTIYIDAPPQCGSVTATATFVDNQGKTGTASDILVGSGTGTGTGICGTLL